MASSLVVMKIFPYVKGILRMLSASDTVLGTRDMATRQTGSDILLSGESHTIGR